MKQVTEEQGHRQFDSMTLQCAEIGLCQVGFLLSYAMSIFRMWQVPSERKNGRLHAVMRPSYWISGKE